MTYTQNTADYFRRRGDGEYPIAVTLQPTYGFFPDKGQVLGDEKSLLFPDSYRHIRGTHQEHQEHGVMVLVNGHRVDIPYASIDRVVLEKSA